MRSRRMMPMRIGYDSEFRTKLVEDHGAIARYNDYEYEKESDRRTLAGYWMRTPGFWRSARDPEH